MIFKKLFLWILLFCVTNCALKIGEPAPPQPRYILDPASESCENLNYKKVFSDYFFNPKSLNSNQLANVLKCLSLNIDEAVYSINNEYLTRENITGLIEQEFVDFGAFNSTLNFILYSEYSDSFLSIKNNLFQLINKDFNVVSFHNNFTCSNTENNEKLISKSEALYLSPFLDRLAQWFRFIEQSADDIQKSLFIKYQINQNDILLDKKYLLLFQSFLYFKLKNQFPEYSLFLISQKENIQRVLPIIDMLSLPSQTDGVNVLNVKYMLFNIYLTQIFFNIYDLNKDSTLSQKELMPLACMISPIIELVMTNILNDRPRTKKIAETLNLTELSPIVHYIISQQKIPNTLDYLLHRTIQDPETFSYSLDYEDVTRLISLLFTHGLQTLQTTENLNQYFTTINHEDEKSN